MFRVLSQLQVVICVGGSAYANQRKKEKYHLTSTASQITRSLGSCQAVGRCKTLRQVTAGTVYGQHVVCPPIQKLGDPWNAAPIDR